MELASIEDPQAKWQRAVDTAVRAEELGYDSVWVYDHVHNVPTPAHEAVFECWTTRRRDQPAHQPHPARARWSGCTSYRNPALLAKITSTVDVISGGRLDWGIGAGWYERRVPGLRLRLPVGRHPHRDARDCVEIVKRMWTEPDATYEGTHFSVAGAQCDPKPLQDPHPPIWIGGGGERKTLRVVATHATHSNFGGKPDEWAHKRDVLRGHCEAVGRDPDEITMTWSPEVFIRETEAEVGTDQPLVLGRAVRVVERRQPGRHARAGRRADPHLRRPRLPGLRAVVRGLPRPRDDGAARHEGDPRAPLKRGGARPGHAGVVQGG